MAYTTIDDPTLYFNTVLYTGNGSADHAITGFNHSTDWVWIKRRNSAVDHRLYDIVRGANKGLETNNTDAEITTTTNVKSFDSDGFTTDGGSTTNVSGGTFVAWSWEAGGTASSNTDGSITSSVSANTTAGFSIVSWTGTGSAATIGHSLGTTPSMIITKSRSASGGWYTYHKSEGATKFLQLSTTDASTTNSTVWNNTEPTSSVFSTGTAFDSGTTYIAYCFAEKKGYSKFGIYNGVGSFPSDVTNFVYTGFKPAFIMLKQTAGEAWNIVDNKRAYEYNPTGYFLYANTSGAEAGSVTYSEMDLLSNGFCLRKAHGQYNETGKQYIYMAFAENPFVTSTGICCTAR